MCETVSFSLHSVKNGANNWIWGEFKENLLTGQSKIEQLENIGKANTAERDILYMYSTYTVFQHVQWWKTCFYLKRVYICAMG